MKDKHYKPRLPSEEIEETAFAMFGKRQPIGDFEVDIARWKALMQWLDDKFPLEEEK